MENMADRLALGKNAIVELELSNRQVKLPFT
jgi:hypothetical protein